MHVFLTSSVHAVAHQVAADIGSRVHGMKLAFIRTAAEAEEGPFDWLEADRAALQSAGFDVTDYTFTDKNVQEVRDELSTFDVLYMEGGHTFYLLQQMQQCGAIEIIRDLVQNHGKIYIGTSAGSIVAGPDVAPAQLGESYEKAPQLDGTIGLCLVQFVIFPHWGSRAFAEIYHNERLDTAYESKHPIVLLRDSMYVEVKDDWYQIKRAPRVT